MSQILPDLQASTILTSAVIYCYTAMNYEQYDGIHRCVITQSLPNSIRSVSVSKKGFEMMPYCPKSSNTTHRMTYSGQMIKASSMCIFM